MLNTPRNWVFSSSCPHILTVMGQVPKACQASLAALQPCHISAGSWPSALHLTQFWVKPHFPPPPQPQFVTSGPRFSQASKIQHWIHPRPHFFPVYSSELWSWESKPRKTHIYWSLKEELLLKTWGFQMPAYLSISNCSSPCSTLHWQRFTNYPLEVSWATPALMLCFAIKCIPATTWGRRKKYSFQFCNDLLTALKHWGEGGGLGRRGEV